MSTRVPTYQQTHVNPQMTHTFSFVARTLLKKVEEPTLQPPQNGPPYDRPQSTKYQEISNIGFKNNYLVIFSLDAPVRNTTVAKKPILVMLPNKNQVHSINI